VAVEEEAIGAVEVAAEVVVAAEAAEAEEEVTVAVGGAEEAEVARA